MQSELAAVFQQLDRTLADTQDMWLPQPFTSNELPWSSTHAHIERALLDLDDTRARELHDNPQARLRWFRELEPDLCAALGIFDPKPTDIVQGLKPGNADQAHVPGRKWQQIVAFASALPHKKLPIVDWCAGKGHLSRIVQRSQGQPVYCLEWNPALLAEGELLASKQSLDIRYYRQDVMQALPGTCSGSGMVHMGLHACGKLHHRLLEHVAQTSATAVALSPCCYHKISTDFYQPLSSQAQQTRLSLDRPALHLAVQDAATSRAAERLLREQERLWRLAFDALQRDIRGVDQYLNVPSCRRELMREDFAGFCRWAARCRELTLPAVIDYDHYLRQGLVKHKQTVRLELLRHLFSRPLELWLVLDCALYLEEHGYRINISQFCERAVSPRNLLIQGYKI